MEDTMKHIPNANVLEKTVRDMINLFPILEEDKLLTKEDVQTCRRLFDLLHTYKKNEAQIKGIELTDEMAKLDQAIQAYEVRLGLVIEGIDLNSEKGNVRK